MNLNAFNEFYLNDLLNNLSKENKVVFLLGDFNINLPNSAQDTQTDKCFDSLSSHLFLAHILQLIKVRVTPKLLQTIYFQMQISQYYNWESHIIYLRSLATIKI